MKCHSLLLYFLLSICANIYTTAKAQAVDVNDSLALVDLYDSTNGPGWYRHANWLTTQPVSTWYGITVTENRVIKIDLYSNRLTGTLPSSIGYLTALTWIELSDNSLSGSIPSSIGNLVNLELMNIYRNQLS